MTVQEMYEVLAKLIEEGKGEYEIRQSYNTIEELVVVDKWQEVYV